MTLREQIASDMDRIVHAAHMAERARCTRILAEALNDGTLSLPQYEQLTRRIEDDNA